MGARSDKRFQPVFHRFGTVTHVTNDTASVVNYGHTHIDSTGTYTIAAPVVGVQKTITLTGNDTAHAAGDFQIQTNSSSVVFAGTTFNNIQNTTDLNFKAGGTVNTVSIVLVGLSTSSWAMVQPVFANDVPVPGSSCITIAAAAQA